MRRNLNIGKSGSLKLLEVQSNPLNCETPLSVLDRRITPIELFYIRSHFPIPDIYPSDWRLNVVGTVETPLQLTLKELQQMRQRRVVATLECAGNSRSYFRIRSKELQWGPGAVSTAEWLGISVSDLLKRAGFQSEAKEVIFEGADRGDEPGTSRPISFARSLPLWKALEPHTIIALQMNGKPLPREHGYPARLIVPGWYAMASVKWLKRVGVSSRPFKGFFQTVKYVYEGQVNDKTVREPVTELRVKSLITSPADGEMLVKRRQSIRGVTWSGSGRIVRLEVEVGRKRLASRLLPSIGRFSWSPWKISWTPVRSGTFTLTARATDDKGNKQPLKPIPDRYQYGYNAVHEIRVHVK